MVGYVEDLELISVSDILNNVSISLSAAEHERFLNTTSSTSVTGNRTTIENQRFTDTTPANIQGNVENFGHIDDSLLKIPNPVGYLQELCVKRGFTLPIYGISKQEGPSHNPTFSVYCDVQERYRGEAFSNTKKKAKEMAAREVLMCIKKAGDEERIIEIDNKTVQIFNTETSAENPIEHSKPPARNMNYVGFLQELCVRKHLPPPNYGTDRSTGTPNNPSFYIFCEVGPFREIGIASNKKTAKQLAAEKVLDHLEMLKTKTESFDKEITHAGTVIPSTITPFPILSESPLENFTVIPNPVGHLQELCVKYRLKPPLYEIVSIDGPPHCPTFITSCKVEYFYQEASSSNKKKGKELAASKILKSFMECRTASE